jgi:flagellin-specific chaperone FliS
VNDEQREANRGVYKQNQVHSSSPQQLTASNSRGTE